MFVFLDKEYLRIQDELRAIICKKKAPFFDVTNQDKKYNKRTDSDRVVVENVFEWIKNL